MDLPAKVFEEIKRINEYGSEYWSARDMANILGYSEYRHFLPVLNKAKESCQKSNQPQKDHFEEVLDMIKLPHIHFPLLN